MLRLLTYINDMYTYDDDIILIYLIYNDIFYKCV
jgi:hypothetical protein